MALRGSLTAQIVRTYLRMTGKGKLVSPEALLDLLQNGRPSGVLRSVDTRPQLRRAWQRLAGLYKFGTGYREILHHRAG
jgi:hypothetical protein